MRSYSVYTHTSKIGITINEVSMVKVKFIKNGQKNRPTFLIFNITTSTFTLAIILNQLI